MTSGQNKAVKLDQELMLQEKATLEKEWNLLAVMKAQMSETKSQLENDRKACKNVTKFNSHSILHKE